MRGDCRFLVSLQLQYNQNFKFCSVQHFVRSIFSPFLSKFGSVVISLWTLWSAFAHCRLSGGISSLLGSHPAWQPSLLLGPQGCLCPEAQLVLLRPKARGVKMSLTWNRSLHLAWRGLGMRSSSFSPEFSVTLLRVGRNFGERRRLAGKEMKTQPVGCESTGTAQRSEESWGIRAD